MIETGQFSAVESGERLEFEAAPRYEPEGADEKDVTEHVGPFTAAEAGGGGAGP
jgi:hypothetical protein